MGHAPSPELLPGTLDLLILKALAPGPPHRYGIAQRLKTMFGAVLEVGESSLYPALQRLLLKGWTNAELGVPGTTAVPGIYTPTAAGRMQLAVERAEFDRLIVAVHQVLNAT